MTIKSILAFFGTLFILAGAPQAGAGEKDGAALLEKLRERLEYSYGPVWATGDAAKFVSEFLTNDAVITASDSPAVWSGKEQNTALIAELMAGYPRISAKVVWAAPAGKEAAYQFVEFQLMPAEEGAPPVTAKSLYVWVKTKDGWRVAADHYSYTGMDAPTGLHKGK